MKRLFFALDITNNDKQLLTHWRDKALNLPFKTITTENFHITLAFLGNTSSVQQQQLTDSANKFSQQISPITSPILQLNHVGLFKKPKVMYLGLQTCPDWLNDLANNLSQAAIKIGLLQEKRAYCPHLSIYRKAHAMDDGSLNIGMSDIEMSDKKIIIKINSFSLYRSVSSEQGVIYTPITTWKLTT
ncbi:MAG: RNA 2',3'-cyclic phosphodiesterase [Alteromonadaceae bacterium]|nr:RNA 2',3'-cyclic phosphodiesterase [Alteromonadaceae bacterium]